MHNTFVFSFTAGCPITDTVLCWVQGLCGAPDVPHTANVSFMTEGIGVGSLTEPPVTATGLSPNKKVDNLVRTQAASNLCFQIKLTEQIQVSWETVLRNGRLFVEVPDGILPDGSKER